MIAVADTGSLHYLVLIGAVNILLSLYSSVLVPQTVIGELNNLGAPKLVRTWAAQPPEWCEIRPDPPSDPNSRFVPTVS